MLDLLIAIFSLPIALAGTVAIFAAIEAVQNYFK